jgi:hypothetical protein
MGHYRGLFRACPLVNPFHSPLWQTKKPRCTRATVTQAARHPPHDQSQQHEKDMKTQVRPFKVETRSKRRPVQSSTSSVNWGMSADEGARKDMPSREMEKAGSMRASSGTAFEEASRVFGAFMANTASAAASMTELASAVFAPRVAEPTPTPPPETVELAAPRGRRILPSLDPAPMQEPEVARESTPKRRASRPRKAETAQVVTGAPEVLAEAAIEAEAEGIDSAPAVAPVETPIQKNVPEPLRTRRLSRRMRVPAGERWKRRRLPKVLW